MRLDGVADPFSFPCKIIMRYGIVVIIVGQPREEKTIMILCFLNSRMNVIHQWLFNDLLNNSLKQVEILFLEFAALLLSTFEIKSNVGIMTKSDNIITEKNLT